MSGRPRLLLALLTVLALGLLLLLVFGATDRSSLLGLGRFALWTEIATNKGIHFEPEEIIARGDRGEIRWRLVWGSAPENSVRGVNLMRVRDGKIVEARGYVKGP